MQENERDNAENLMNNAKKKKKAIKKLLEDKIKQINLLEQERQEVLDKLKKRETDLYKYKFKIKDLQKAKHVLTHRTTEMRQSLEPKEQQIENLKD
jgi:serine phosphatase RsbU (regulator of sigma subunit)